MFQNPLAETELKHSYRDDEKGKVVIDDANANDAWGAQASRDHKSGHPSEEDEDEDDDDDIPGAVPNPTHSHHRSSKNLFQQFHTTTAEPLLSLDLFNTVITNEGFIEDAHWKTDNVFRYIWEQLLIGDAYSVGVTSIHNPPNHHWRF